MQFYYTIAPCGQQNDRSYRLRYNIYKKYGQQQLEKYAREIDNVLDHCAVWVSGLKDGNIVGHLPAESIQGLSLFHICSDSISHEMARTSWSYCCSWALAPAEECPTLAAMATWQHNQNCNKHKDWTYHNFSQYQILMDLIFAICLICKNWIHKNPALWYAEV